MTPCFIPFWEFLFEQPGFMSKFVITNLFFLPSRSSQYCETLVAFERGTSYIISIIQKKPTNQTKQTNQPHQPTFLTGHFQIFNSCSIFSHPAITGSLDSHSVLERQESLSLLWSHHFMSWSLHQIISIKIGCSTSQIQHRTKEPGRLEHKSNKKASSVRVCVHVFLGGALEACVSYAFHLKLVHPDHSLYRIGLFRLEFLLRTQTERTCRQTWQVGPSWIIKRLS